MPTACSSGRPAALLPGGAGASGYAARVRLAARSMGSAFPAPPFSGFVHSVYPRALNIASGDGRLVASLVSDPLLEHPASSTVEAEVRERDPVVAAPCSGLDRREPEIRFDLSGARPGAPLRLNDGWLRIEGGPMIAFDGTVRSRGRAEETPPAPSLPVDPGQRRAFLAERALLLDAAQRAAGTTLRASLLLRACGSSAPESLLEERFVQGAVALASGFSRGASEEALDGALQLVGLGPGLTPTGDDFLCGFAAAAFALAAGSESPAAGPASEDAASSGRTGQEGSALPSRSGQEGEAALPSIGRGTDPDPAEGEASEGCHGRREPGSDGFVRSWAEGLYLSASGGDPGGSRSGRQRRALTGQVSLLFLEQAARGRFSAALMGLARSLSGGAGIDDFLLSLDELGRIGHSSGYDAAMGFLFCLEQGIPGAKITRRQELPAAAHTRM